MPLRSSWLISLMKHADAATESSSSEKPSNRKWDWKHHMPSKLSTGFFKSLWVLLSLKRRISFYLSRLRIRVNYLWFSLFSPCPMNSPGNKLPPLFSKHGLYGNGSSWRILQCTLLCWSYSCPQISGVLDAEITALQSNQKYMFI